MLAKYERKLGHDSWSMAIGKTYLNYKADERVHGSLWRQELFRLKMFKRALKSDVIFYNAGSSIAPTPSFQYDPNTKHPAIFHFLYSLYSMLFCMVDVFILRLLGKHISVIFQGGDARLNADEVFGIKLHWYDRWVNQIKRIRIKLWSRWADRIYYLNPDLAWHLPERAQFLPYICCEIDEIPIIPVKPDGPLVIGHIVNHPHFKGTKEILKSLITLRKLGLVFDTEIHFNIPREQAMKIYERIDILIEQVKYFYAAQAVECMAMGKTVVSPIRQKDTVFLPKKMLSDLDTLLPRQYVQKWHNPMKITKWILRDYENSTRTY